MSLRALDQIRPWQICFAAGVISLWPLIQSSTDFAALFYFEDEWDLLNMWAQTDFPHWAGSAFAENFVPLFKLIWGGTIYWFKGGYFTLIVLLWLNHALNVVLLTRLMQRLGSGTIIAGLSGLMFGLSPLHLETLAWSVQWSAVMSLTCMLSGLLLFTRYKTNSTSLPSWGQLGLLGLCSLASPLCFSRGVLTGLVLAVAAFLCLGWRRWSVILSVILPALTVAMLVVTRTEGNHHHFAGAGQAIAEFALYYFAQCPLRPLLSTETPALLGVLALATGKLVIFIIGWRVAPRPARPVLLALASFDVGNALLLGLGRHHTGLAAAVSSRYQYAALLALVPFLAVIAGQYYGRLPSVLRLPLTALACAAILWQASSQWPSQIHEWSSWRGRDLRAALTLPPAQAPNNFARLPWMTNERTRELIVRYNLH